MNYRSFTAIVAAAAAFVAGTASADVPSAGDNEIIVQSIALFTNNNENYGQTAYYDTSGSQTNYGLSAAWGIGVGDGFETGLNLGYGHLNSEICDNQTCNNVALNSHAWGVFVRHNFVGANDRASYAFSGLEVSAVYPQNSFGRITVVHPYVGYRFGLPQNWALELVVGGFQSVSGNAQISSGYEVRAGVAIPFR